MLLNLIEGGLTDVGKCYGRKVDRCWLILFKVG